MSCVRIKRRGTSTRAVYVEIHKYREPIFFREKACINWIRNPSDWMWEEYYKWEKESK